MTSSLMISKWGRKLGKHLMNPKPKFKPKFVTTKWNIVRGDVVQVTEGPQTGQKGKVKAVLRAANRVIVEDCNMVRSKWSLSRSSVPLIVFSSSPLLIFSSFLFSLMFI
jgi:hypothetical protein